MRRMEGTRHDVHSAPSLDPKLAYRFWAGLPSDPVAAGALGRAWPPPSASHLLATSKEETANGLRDTRDSAAGPDGLPPIVLKLYSDLLSNELAPMIT